MKKNIRDVVYFKDVAEAIGQGSVESKYYLDIETGEIIWLPDPDIAEDEFEDDRARIDSDTTNRYQRLPIVNSYEGYRNMEDFIEILPDGKLKEALYIAINGQGAFRRFKDVLLGYPEERESWFKFEHHRNLERAKEWLEELDIEMNRYSNEDTGTH
jgi:hypothetical protein